MRPSDDINKLIKKMKLKASANLDKRVHEKISNAPANIKSKQSAHSQPAIWRIIMKSNITKFAAAAVIIIAIFLAANLWDRTTPSAYALEQTIEAIRKIDTVYMAGEFYKQGQFECWMRYNDEPDLPTHVWMGNMGFNINKICSPDGVFFLNERTNRVFFVARDERGMSWIPKFASFFETATNSSDSDSGINIYNEKDIESGREIIVVEISTPQREQRFLIDPETKLPFRFETVRDDNPAEMIQKTLAIKNLKQISYNQQPPIGLFNLPADAVTVEEQIDCIVDPDSGLIADEMTERQACLEIVRQFGQAFIDVDIEILQSLNLSYRGYPPYMWEQLEQRKNAGQWLSEFNITGQPYQEEGFWFVPCEMVMAGGQSETQNAMIKFFNLEGKSLCFLVNSR